MLEEIVVLGRFAANNFDSDRRFIAISITDPGVDVALKRTRWCLKEEDILRLAFDDIDPHLHDPEVVFGYQPMLPHHARQIKTFLEERKDAERLLIHCEAGISRSPSIAMAICDVLGLPRGIIRWSRNPELEPPNLHVYTTTTDALLPLLKEQLNGLE